MFCIKWFFEQIGIDILSCDIKFSWIKLELYVLFVYGEFRFSVATGFASFFLMVYWFCFVLF
jgi:hypothetical protein